MLESCCYRPFVESVTCPSFERLGFLLLPPHLLLLALPWALLAVEQHSLTAHCLPSRLPTTVDL